MIKYMKKVFSSLLLIFILPLRQFKKIFKDNFLSGLILGAIFSLLVNVMSMQLQTIVEKQRILEALENEIAANYIQAVSDTDNALNERKNQKNANIFTLTHRFFLRDLWEQSTDARQYVAQLDQKQQRQINAYYNYLIPITNLYVETSNEINIKFMERCFDPNEEITVVEQQSCNEMYYSLLTGNASNLSYKVALESYNVLEAFHPTKDRLNSPLLRFLIGSESIRILSGK